VVVIGDERFAQPLGPTVIPGQRRHTEAHGFVHPGRLDVGGRPVGHENFELALAVVADDGFRGVVRAAEVDDSRITAEDGVAVVGAPDRAAGRQIDGGEPATGMVGGGHQTDVADQLHTGQVIGTDIGAGEHRVVCVLERIVGLVRACGHRHKNRAQCHSTHCPQRPLRRHGGTT
jgi:hypothetical protein